MPSIRDDFPDTVKRVLAARVNLRCSRPDCRASTSGPQVEPAKALNVGVAAHITAAAEGGPRFDPTMAPDERAAISNGIWLCQNCAKLVDNDPARFTAALLREWTLAAEHEALTVIGKAGRPRTSSPGTEQSDISPTFLEHLRLLPLEGKIYEDVVKILGHPSFPRAMSLSGEIVFNPVWPSELDDSHRYLIAIFSPAGPTPPRVMLLDIFLIKAADQTGRPCVLTYFSGKPRSGWQTFLFPFRKREPGETERARLDLNATDLAH